MPPALHCLLQDDPGLPKAASSAPSQEAWEASPGAAAATPRAAAPAATDSQGSEHAATGRQLERLLRLDSEDPLAQVRCSCSASGCLLPACCAAGGLLVACTLIAVCLLMHRLRPSLLVLRQCYCRLPALLRL